MSIVCELLAAGDLVGAVDVCASSYEYCRRVLVSELSKRLRSLGADELPGDVKAHEIVRAVEERLQRVMRRDLERLSRQLAAAQLRARLRSILYPSLLVALEMLGIRCSLAGAGRR